jgi:hypothetical protein
MSYKPPSAKLSSLAGSLCIFLKFKKWHNCVWASHFEICGRLADQFSASLWVVVSTRHSSFCCSAKRIDRGAMLLSLVWTWMVLAQVLAHHVTGRIGPQNIVSRQYIVYFSDDIDEALVPEMAADVARQAGGQILWIYQHAVKGVALTVKSGFRLKDHLNFASVASIEEVS